MLRVKLSVVYAVLLALGIGLLGGCASTADEKASKMSPEKLYAEARDYLDSGQWDKAVPFLEKLEARAAGTPLAQQAQLEKAYAQFKSGEKAQAVTTLERFIRLHPASPALDYALYLKGLTNFNEDMGLLGAYIGQDLAERDQKAAKESFDAFKELSTRFPESRYTPDGLLRMRYIVQTLAKSEVFVARYYYKRGAYLAAINRAQTAITEYRDVPAMEDALYILYKSYDALGMTALRDDTKRILDASYPQSTLLANGGKNVEKSMWDWEELSWSKIKVNWPKLDFIQFGSESKAK